MVQSSPRESKYNLLFRQLKAQIESGALAPGDRMPTFVEMRAQYGVVPTTVDRIYGMLEQEGLIVREQGRGTFVKQPAPRRANGVVGIHGVADSQPTHPYYAHLIEGFREVAGPEDIELLLLNETSEITWDKVDGVITYAAPPPGFPPLQRRMPAGMPCVSALVSDPKLPSVMADDYQGAYDVTQHFLELGHRRIAYLHDPVSRRRLSGFRDALRDAGIEPEDSWEYPLDYAANEVSWTYGRCAYTSMASWLAGNWRSLACTALLAQNDDAAIGAIRALREAGVAVPQDVSIAGFDGTEIGNFFVPTLTSVEVPLREIGAAAMELLLRQIRGEEVKIGTLLLPTHVIIRQSSVAVGS